MWRQSLNNVDPVAGSAGAAAVCALVSQHLHSRQAELSSELICWAALPFIFAFAKQSGLAASGTRATLSGSFRPQATTTSLGSVWIVALCVVLVSVYRQEIGAIASLPALVPLLLMAEKRFRSVAQFSRMLDSWSPSPLVQSVGASAVIGLLASLTLAEWCLRPLFYSAAPAAALYILYAALIPRDPDLPSLFPHLDLEDAVIALSAHTVVISIAAMILRTIVLGFPSSGVMSTLFLGLAKALSWYFTTQTTRYTSWTIAAAVSTYALFSSADLALLPSDGQALTFSIISFLSLSQVIHMLPRQSKARVFLWLLCLASLIPYLSNLSAIRHARTSAPTDFGTHAHPVDALIQRARADFGAVLRNQSTSLSAAQDEYRRRYRRDPPPGFDAWYDFAVAHQSPIIDEFDTIHHSISPFLRSLSGAEFRDTINDAYDFVGSELWLCSFSGKSAKTECGHPYRTFDRHISLLVNKLFGDLPGAIPDVKFLFNHLDEPRVLLPAKIGKVYGKRQFRITDLTHQSNFDTLTRFCASHKKDKPSSKGYQVEPFGLPFVTDRDAAMDLCQHPEYANMHGLFMSPSSLPLIEGLVPVLSTGAPSTMGDILFPTPAYMESEFLFDESRDIDWDSKNNIVYWAGSTTGGFADKPGQWRFFQRQRFVEFVQKLKGRTYKYLRGQGGAIKSVASSFLNGRLYDVAFTRFLHCDRKYCHEQSLYFRTKSWADKDAPLKSKLVFDLDGNGISGRYYKLVASKSAPLKQTLLREWHDDRLIPWVHFIPVSQSMEELPELVFYLTSTDAGQKQAKEIADQGREWYRKAFREIDMTIYTYRLLLELARLQDPTREADL